MRSATVAAAVCTGLSLTLSPSRFVGRRALEPRWSTVSGGQDDCVPSALRSVCKIYVTVVEPDYAQPWSVFAEEEAVGSGFVVQDGGKALRVLTNAHVVRWCTEVRVRRHGDTKRFKARVIGVSEEADLALLAIDDVEFWRRGRPIMPLRWAGLPELYDDVAVVGYPMGGDNVCVTRGVVSRVDTMAYARGAPALLVVQIDAAVNSGNSGGPCLSSDGRVVGVAFSGYAGSADNIGYIIPESVARTFLAECAAERQRHRRSGAASDDAALFVARVDVCTLGVVVQPTENEALRTSLRLGERSGVLVTRVAETSCAAHVVRPGDVLLSIGGANVADDGTVELRADERVDLSHAATSRRAGESVYLELLRDGERLVANVTFAPLPRLVPIAETDRPSYLVLGGLVLMRLTLPLLEAEAKYHHDDEDPHPQHDDRLLALHSRALGMERSAQPDAPAELVVWTSTLTADANFGYQCRDLPVLKSVCGVPVTSLAHVAQIIDDADATNDKFYRLDFVPPHPRPGDVIKVVLDADQVHQANDDILRRRYLPALASPDVVDALYTYRNLPQNHKQAARRTRQGARSNYATKSSRSYNRQENDASRGRRR